MNNLDECCGLCKYHHYENASDGYVCTNDDSDYCTDWTDYNDCCDEFESRYDNFSKIRRLGNE